MASSLWRSKKVRGDTLEKFSLVRDLAATERSDSDSLTRSAIALYCVERLRQSGVSISFHAGRFNSESSRRLIAMISAIQDDTVEKYKKLYQIWVAYQELMLRLNLIQDSASDDDFFSRVEGIVTMYKKQLFSFGEVG